MEFHSLYQLDSSGVADRCRDTLISLSFNRHIQLSLIKIRTNTISQLRIHHLRQIDLRRSSIFQMDKLNIGLPYKNL
jgi:negative regulator of sigma E activity